MTSSYRSISLSNGTAVYNLPLGSQLIMPGAIIDESSGSVSVGVTPQLFGAFTLDEPTLRSALITINSNVAVAMTDEVIPGFSPQGPRIHAVAGAFTIANEGYYLLSIEVTSSSTSIAVGYHLQLRNGSTTIAVTNPGLASAEIFGGSRYKMTRLVYLPPGTYTARVRSFISVVLIPGTVTGTLRITAQVL